MTEMIERVARALWERRRSDTFDTLRSMGGGHQNFMGVPLFDRLPVSLQDSIRADARAAIEAMREPTEGMLEAGAVSQALACGDINHGSWERMIDAALGEGEKA